MGLKNWLKDKVSKVVGVLRKAEDVFCDAVDYLRYDQVLIATTLRAADTIVCALASPAMTLIGVAAKVSYYGTGHLLGLTKEQLDEPFEKVSNTIGNISDKVMNYLGSKGVNVRFLGDLGSTVLHFIDYKNVGKLTRTGLNKVNGIYNEGARRYKNNLLKRAEQAKNKEINKINRNLRELQKKNFEKYKQNRQIAKARKNAIKEDIKRQKEEIERKKPLMNKKFRQNFGRLIMDELSGYFKYLKSLTFNSLWLLKENFMNYLSNFLGDMGNYGFHTCPYGCGRPIPDAFRGCTELLQAIPDYFD